MKTAILVANGPSLKKFDFSKTKDFDVMILNRGYLLGDKISPKFLVVVNDLVIEQFGDEIVNYCRRNGVILFSDTHRYKNLSGVSKVHLSFRGDFPHFETQFGKPIWQGHTVTYVGMQLLYQMEYEKVIVIGLDHYYKRAEGKPTNKKEFIQGEDIDHFHPEYFKGVYWHTPNLFASEIAYRLARVYYEWGKRILVNSTEDSRLSPCVLKQVSFDAAVNINWKDYISIE